MLDFTSSLYLGLRHPSHSLAPWSQLTTGKPAMLGASPCAVTIATALAELQGCEKGMLFPSTLHLFFDLFEMLRRKDIQVYVDSGAYPIARWAVERIQALGTPVRQLPHFDAEAACEIVAADAGSRRRPVILADGYCVTCGRFAPLASYLAAVAPRRGYIVIDDTQALGIWGRHPRPHLPYGEGGGGSLRYHAIRSNRIVTGSSLAKSFGVPIAVLGGSGSLIRRLEQSGKTRMHTSPPSLADLKATERALAINSREGDALRHRLATLVICFRSQVKAIPLGLGLGLFPAQILHLPHRANAVRVQEYLLAEGIGTVIVNGCNAAAGLVLLLTARHQPSDIARLATMLTSICRSDRNARELCRPRRSDGLSSLSISSNRC